MRAHAASRRRGVRAAAIALRRRLHLRCPGANSASRAAPRLRGRGGTPTSRLPTFRCTEPRSVSSEARRGQAYPLRLPGAAPAGLTAAWPQVFRKSLPRSWRLYEETPVLATGPRLRRVPTDQVQFSGRPVSVAGVVAGDMAVGRWRSDLLAVSESCKKIALVELCRLCRPSNVPFLRLDTAY